MENVELVCIVCKKENRGNGVWSYHDSSSTWKQEDGLCPDCRQELFPEFGKGDRWSAKGTFKVGHIMRFVFNQFGLSVNSTR